MRLLPKGLCKAHSPILILFLLVLTVVARVSAEPAGDTTSDTTAQTTADHSTTETTPNVTDTTASTTESTSSSTSTSTSESTTSTTTSTTSSTSSTTTSMDPTTTTSSETSTSTTDSTTTTSSVPTTTTTSSSSTTTSGPIVTIPPIANAPYMQTSNTPEGTVFIAVGAILGFIGLAVLAWRGMVAWSVNRSVRRAAMAHSSKSKQLLRGSRKKRSTVYTAAPAGDVSLEKLGAATRASVKPSKRVPSSNSGLFFSPTAGPAPGSHTSLHAASNRGSTYLPAGYYAAAGSSTPVRDSGVPHAGLSSPQGYPPSSPSLPPIGTYHDGPHNARSSYVGASTSSLNLSQAPQGRAPSAYLEDLFESHAPPRNSDSGRR